MMKSRVIIGIILMIFALAAIPANANTEKIDLFLLVDASQSMNSSEYNLQKQGLAYAINNSTIVPQDGTVNVSVIQFSSSVRVEVPLTTINSQSDADNISADILAMNRSGLGIFTNIAGAIDLAVQNLPTNLSGRQIIDISTDGVPNYYNGSYVGTTLGINYSLNSRDYANSSGFEELNAIGVGNNLNETFMKELVYPQPWTTNPGFYTYASDFQDFQDKIEEKIIREIKNPQIDIEKYTNGQDSDSPPGQSIPVGNTVTWWYNVTNTGNVNLTNVTITDNVTGFTYNCGTLAIGQWCNVTNTSTAIEGQYANLGNVTGDYNGFSANDSDPSHYFGINTSIDIEKYTNGEDADTPTGPVIPVGDTVTWWYNVTNTGNVNLTNVTITDSVTGFTHNCGILVPGQWCNVTNTSTAIEGQYANLGNVTGDYNGFSVNDSDPSHYFGANASVDIEKYTNGFDSDSAPGKLIPVGNTVTWWYNVTNTGNVNLTDVTITDNRTGFTHNCGTLVPGQWCNVTNTSTAIEGQYANLGNVTGDYNGFSVNDSDPSHYFGANASIDIEKYTNGFDSDSAPGKLIPVGNTVTWWYNVTNTGNVNLTDVTITDNRTGFTHNCGTLVPGQWCNVTNTSTAIEGQYANLGNVTGDYNGFSVNDSDPSHYFGEEEEPKVPSIDIEKYTNGEDADSPTGPVVPVGSTITWSYNVTNNGNVPLANVTITDNVTGFTYDCGILTPGQWCNVTNTSIAIEGQYANLGNVTGNYSSLEVNDTDPSHYFGAVPSIDIEKFTEGEDADDPTGPELVIGDTVEWTYVVKNNGTATLTNITVVDDKGVTVICPKDTLVPGESMTCTATGTVGEGQYVNNATVTAKFGDIEVNDTDPSHYFGTEGGEEPVPATNVLITAGLLGLVVALFMRRER